MHSSETPQQEMVSTTILDVMVGEAISFFRIYLVRKSPRPIHELYNIIGQMSDSKCRPEIKHCLGTSILELRNFFENHGTFFDVRNDLVALKPTRTRDEIEHMLSDHKKVDDAREGSRVSEVISLKCSRQKLNVCIISNPEECTKLVLHITKQSQAIAVDCEGEGLGTYGKLSLVQIATYNGEVYLFDILATKSKDDLFKRGKLKDLLEGDDVVKVMHNCRGDSTTLYDEFGISLNNVFDTESAYHALLEQYNDDCRQSSPGLNQIVSLFGGPVNSVKNSHIIKTGMIHDRHYWSRRPMTEQMIQYAANDVSALVPTVYEKMNRAINPEWRSLFNKLCQDNSRWYLTRK